MPEELLSFLRYVKKGAAMRRESAAELKDDPLLDGLEKRLWEIKKNRGLEERYMLFGELLEKERREGREEGREEGLETFSALITAMNGDGKGSELCRLNEPEFLEEMLERYGIQ